MSLKSWEVIPFVKLLLLMIKEDNTQIKYKNNQLIFDIDVIFHNKFNIPNLKRIDILNESDNEHKVDPNGFYSTVILRQYISQYYHWKHQLNTKDISLV